MLGNPAHAGGRFHQISRSRNWVFLRIAAHEHPNIREEPVAIAGGPAPNWPEQVAAEYGTDSPFYRAFVEGEFPTEGSIDALIRRVWLDASGAKCTGIFHPTERVGDARILEDPVIGVDVARFGADKSALAVARGAVVHELFTWQGASVTETADVVIDHAEKVCKRDIWGRRPVLWVDEPGLGGGLVDIRVIVGWRSRHSTEQRVAATPQRFLNRHAEAHWHFRSLIESGRAAFPPDPMLFEEALALEWTIAPNGTIQIVSKDTFAEGAVGARTVWTR